MNKEYNVYKAIAQYLRYQYPNVLYHFDITGVNLSKAQAGMAKSVQHSRGFPDLFIAENNNHYKGLFLELKPEGTKLYKKSGQFTTEHIAEQMSCLLELRMRGYQADFACGFDEAKVIIDQYMKK